MKIFRNFIGLAALGAVACLVAIPASAKNLNVAKKATVTASLPLLNAPPDQTLGVLYVEVAMANTASPPEQVSNNTFAAKITVETIAVNATAAGATNAANVAGNAAKKNIGKELINERAATDTSPGNNLSCTCFNAHDGTAAISEAASPPVTA